MSGTVEIIDSIILLQILLLGVFSTGGLIFALLLLFGKLQWARGKLGALCKALCKASAQALIAGGLLTLFPVYFLGVTTHYWAGRWIDKPSYWHLGLKSWWPEDDGDKTDDRIKCAMPLDCLRLKVNAAEQC